MGSGGSGWSHILCPGPNLTLPMKMAYDLVQNLCGGLYWISMVLKIWALTMRQRPQHDGVGVGVSVPSFLPRTALRFFSDDQRRW